MKTLCLILGSGIAAVTVGCSSGPPADMRNDPSVRIPAIKRAVRSGDRSALPGMVRDLRSDDAAIRMYAIEGLRLLTGDDLGYRYYDDAPQRRAATKRWEAWLAEQGREAKGM
jgi:hypothetical protein